MKKYFIIVVAAVALMSAGQQDSPITKENGTDVVNTTTLAKDVEGYNGTVPVKIYIKKNKIEKIEVLKNQETPKYLAMVKKSLLNAWDGLTIKAAKANGIVVEEEKELLRRYSRSTMYHDDADTSDFDVSLDTLTAYFETLSLSQKKRILFPP